MSNLYVQESYVNLDRGYRFGDTPFYESAYSDRGNLFRACVREYGRCTGRVYVDKRDGTPRAVGWVFIKRMPYDNSRETYTREVWITVCDKPPTETTP